MSKDYSVFDIVGPNMIGPSSSHTAGAARVGKMAAKIAGKSIKSVKFILHGSFAETYKGHGTDKALVGGILGFETDDDRIKNSFDIAKERGLEFEFIKEDMGNHEHPNTVKIVMILEDDSTVSVKGASIGGGNIKLTQMNELSIDFNGIRPMLILEIKNIPGAIAFITGLLAHHNKNIATITVSSVDKKTNTAFMSVETDEKLEDEVLEQLKQFDIVLQIAVLDAF